MASKKWRRSNYNDNNDRRDDERKSYRKDNNSRSYNENGNANNTYKKSNYADKKDIKPMKNIQVVIPISEYGCTLNGKTYHPDSLISIMSDLQSNEVFSKISIPVSASIAFNSYGKPKTAQQVLGFIKHFNVEDHNMTFIIYGKQIKNYESIEDPIVVPRVSINGENKCTCILGFDIVTRSKAIPEEAENLSKDDSE